MDKYLFNNNLIIPPSEIVLDSDIYFHALPDGSRGQGYKSITMQYISIRSSIMQLLSKPGFYANLQGSRKYFNDEFYSYFRNGKLASSFQNYKDVIFINLYYDDAEVANPLGSKSGKHKLANFYISIIDLPEHYQS